MIAAARTLLVLVVLLMGLALHSRNHQLVVLDLYLRRHEMPLSWIIVGAFATGALCGIIAMLPRVFGLLRALKRERKLNKLAQTAALGSLSRGA